MPQPVYPRESVQPFYQGYSNISTRSGFIPIGIDQSVESNRSRVNMSSGESGVIVDGRFVNNPNYRERQYNDDYVSRASAIPTDTSSCVRSCSESYYREFVPRETITRESYNNETTPSYDYDRVNLTSAPRTGALVTPETMSPLFPSRGGSYSTIPDRTPLNIGWDEFRNSKCISTTSTDMSKKCHRIRK